MAIQPRYHKVEDHGPIVKWIFDHPPQNLASPETVLEFVELLKAFENNAEQRVGIITGSAPGKFIQHLDVSIILKRAEDLKAATDEDLANLAADRQQPRFTDKVISKPIICAINGPLEGIGCELALYCDFRFMSRDAHLAQIEVDGGFPPGLGIPRLLQLIGLGRTLEFCMTGRKIYADEAERIGLITRSCDPDKLDAVVMQFALSLAQKPPLALSLIKKTTYACGDLSHDESISFGLEQFFRGIRSDDALRLMRLYTGHNQNRDSINQALREAQGDIDKAVELLNSQLEAT